MEDGRGRRCWSWPHRLFLVVLGLQACSIGTWESFRAPLVLCRLSARPGTMHPQARLAEWRQAVRSSGTMQSPEACLPADEKTHKSQRCAATLDRVGCAVPLIAFVVRRRPANIIDVGRMQVTHDPARTRRASQPAGLATGSAHGGGRTHRKRPDRTTARVHCDRPPLLGRHWHRDSEEKNKPRKGSADQTAGRASCCLRPAETPKKWASPPRRGGPSPQARSRRVLTSPPGRSCCTCNFRRQLLKTAAPSNFHARNEHQQT